MVASRKIMVHAYVFLTVSVGKLKEVLSALPQIPEVVRAEGITGPYDIVVYVEVETLATLTKVLMGKIDAIPGVTSSMTAVVVEG